MIKRLSEFDKHVGELVVTYDSTQEELYKKASGELRKEADDWGLKHRSYELGKARDAIQNKYEKEGLQIPIYSFCKGINSGGGNNNFAAMVVKHFLTTNKFRVLASSEDFALIFDRGKRYETQGFGIISKIFGEKKVGELLKKAPRNGGEPDLFVYLDHDPKNACFVEVKRTNERLYPAQRENFPLITDLLCPIVIARIVPSNAGRFPSPIEGSRNSARNADRSCIIRTPVASHEPSKPVNGQ